MATGWDLDRGRVLWWIFGAVLGATLLYIVYRFIGTFVFAVFLYYAARPIHSRLKRRIRPPSLSAAISIMVLLGPALFLVGYVLAISFQELQGFIEEAQGLVEEGGLERYEEWIEPYVELTEVVGSPGDLLTGGGLDAATGLVMATVAYLGDVVLFAIHLFVVFAVAFYLLRDDYKLTRWFRTRFNDDTGAVMAYLRAVDEDFHNIFFGNILNAAITGAIGAIVFTLVNQVAPSDLAIPYPALIGMLTGIASLIPVVGMKIVYVPIAAYLFVVPFATAQPETVWFPAVFTAVAFLVVDTIPDLVLRPYVSGRNLHMGSLMMAYVIGPLLFGWYGLFLLPMILVLVVHFARIVLPELVAGDQIRSKPVGPGYASEDEGSPEVIEDADSPEVNDDADSPEVIDDATREPPVDHTSATDPEGTATRTDETPSREPPARTPGEETKPPSESTGEHFESGRRAIEKESEKMGIESEREDADPDPEDAESGREETGTDPEDAESGREETESQREPTETTGAGGDESATEREEREPEATDGRSTDGGRSDESTDTED